MMNINSAFPSDYLKAADIPAGRRVTVTIENVTIEKLGEDTRPVVYFNGKEKGLVLNKTNANMICEIAKSEETEDWRGIQITLYSTKVDFQGRRVDALRVDYPANGAAHQPQSRHAAPPVAPALPPEAFDPDDQIPF